MRETVRSLRMYFVLVGLYSIGSSLASWAPPNGSLTLILADLFQLVNAGFGIAYCVASWKMPRLLETGGGALVALIFASCGWAVLTIGLAFMGGARSVTLEVTLVLEVLISLYLWRSVKRLSTTPATQ